MRSFRIRVSALVILLALPVAASLRAQAADSAAGGKKVNINTATAAELAYLPRLGAKVAARILEHRKEKPFSRPEELMEVKGIGEKLFVTLKPYLSTTGPTTLTAKVRLSSTSSRRSSVSSGAAKEKPASSVPLGKGR